MPLSKTAKIVWGLVGFAILDAPQWVDAVVDLAERPSTKPYFDRVLAALSVKASMSALVQSSVTVWSLRAVGLIVLLLVAFSIVREYLNRPAPIRRRFLQVDAPTYLANAELFTTGT